MLDQNTDRMWYVIGAVLIGAAIIFGMNTLMPEAFASVSDNFNLITSTIGKNLDYFYADISYLPAPLDFNRAMNMSMYHYMYDTHELLPMGGIEPSMSELDPIRVNGVDYNCYIEIGYTLIPH